MASTKSTRATVTADQLLASLGSVQKNESTFSDKAVEYVADSVDDAVVLASRIGGALMESGSNAVAHFKLERGIQRTRSAARLERAAERAAIRINQYLAAQ